MEVARKSWPRARPGSSLSGEYGLPDRLGDNGRTAVVATVGVFLLLLHFPLLHHLLALTAGGAGLLGRQSKRAKRKDPLYIMRKEYIGRRQEREFVDPARSRPWYLCQISAQTAEDPVVTPNGDIFELYYIASYIAKHGKCPITDKKLALKDLTRIIIKFDEDGNRICPTTGVRLDEEARVVCVRTSGRVYSYQGLEFMDLAGEEEEDAEDIEFNDPVSSEPFRRADVISIQDPWKSAARAERHFKELESQKRVVSFPSILDDRHTRDFG